MSGVCATSGGQARYKFQTISDARNNGVQQDPGASQILCSSELNMHTANCICIYKGEQLKSKRQRTATWCTAAWPPRRLCYRPAVFFLRIHLITLSFLQRKVRGAFKKMLYFFFNFLQLRSLKLRDSRSVCTLFKRLQTKSCAHFFSRKLLAHKHRYGAASVAVQRKLKKQDY